MSTMIAEVYDAFVDAGASEEKAKAAATTLADYESRFDKVDGKLDVIDTKFDVMDAKINSIEKQLELVKWMVGGIFFGMATLLVKTFVS